MVFSIILLLLGIVSMGYFAFYTAINGINDIFLCVWAVLGVLCICWSFLHKWIIRRELLLVKRIEQIIIGVICVCLVAFFITLGTIISEANSEPGKNADYVIVLGAHVFGERMSANLKYRVQAACEYLKENPNTKAVLSGGQGSGEKITEAEAMRRYLVQEGIRQDRLLLDETSVNTDENIQNSAKLIGSKEKRVIIVSNDFHVYRAKRIARKQGFRQVEGLGAKTHPHTVPNSFSREVFAVIKYKLCGQI